MTGISMALLAITLRLHLPLWLVILWASVFYFFHVIGPASQGMTTINAVFPAHERGTAAGWGYFWVKLAAVVGSFWAPTWFATIGVSGTLTFLSVYAIATAILGLIIGMDARKYVPELTEEVR